MKPSRENALEDCLSRTQFGESLDDCLAHYPDYADELYPLLALATDVRRVPVPSARPEIRAAQKQRMLTAVAAQFPAKSSSLALVHRLRATLAPQPILRWAVMLAVVLALLLGGSWLSIQSAADTLPGDTLYPMKRANERIQLLITFDPTAKQQLRSELARKRLEETRAVLGQDRQTRLEFEGLLAEMTASYWIVEGQKIFLMPDTQIEGMPLVGAQVHVRARSPGDGTLLALRLRVKHVPTPQATVSPTMTSLEPSHTPTLPRTTPSPQPTQTSHPTATPTFRHRETPGPTAAPQHQKEPGSRPDRTPRATMTRRIRPQPTLSHVPSHVTPTRHPPRTTATRRLSSRPTLTPATSPQATPTRRPPPRTTPTRRPPPPTLTPSAPPHVTPTRHSPRATPTRRPAPRPTATPAAPPQATSASDLPGEPTSPPEQPRPTAPSKPPPRRTSRPTRRP